ncbi:MAG TPA: ketoacyl-ACP synthase III [Megamonas hypermegale]|uniref:Beta-ketoacyl-[acyl-carrier-protein] synthase III n=1 Tax=Megamonas hypermegale TaxID=158847 RepID=A0A921L754_9FIRM|nr:beta-ketoacyl-ACP synthase III [Megamonas hypermegale]MDM8142706.1 beta-ketoacyl-ACP synthase III [Megamonas hypermegale]HJF84494.1 ketoacyl-ACP synthase III [Megamonas hypermegale]
MTLKLNSAGILGLGSYVPEKILTNADIEKLVDTNDEWITERTGIKERRICAPEQATSDLSLIAAQRALEDANVSAEELDMIIVATISADSNTPSTACVLQNKLGAVNAAAFDLSAACSGFVYGSAIASQFIETGVYKKVLVVGAETLSKFVNWKDRNTCIIFADGAGAAVYGVVDDGYGVLSFDLGADGSGAETIEIPGGGSRHPADQETIDNHMHCLHMNGKETFRFAVKAMGSTVMKSLERAGLSKEDIDYFIPHQANIRIIQSAAKRLHLPMEKVFVNIEKYGNTSAASIPIALAEAEREGKLKKGEIIALSGFGAGLTWASCIMKWAKEG